MKNCKFSPGQFLASKVGRWLPFTLLFFLASCRKDTELVPSELSVPKTLGMLSTSRSSELESKVVAYAQWMLTNMVPVIKDQEVYQDLKNGIYSSARVQAKMNELGFINYEDFATKLADEARPVGQAIRAGLLSQQSIALLLEQHLPELDISALTSGGGISTPGTPCYKKLMATLATIAVSGSLAVLGSGPAWALTSIGVMIAMGAAVIDFYLCMEENYPLGH